MPKHWILLAALALGCSGDKKSDTKKAAEQSAKAKNTKMPPMTKEQLDQAVKEKMSDKSSSESTLVPSPKEMQKALENAGVAEDLSKSASTCDRITFGGNKDRVAVVTGVAMADLALTLNYKEKKITNKEAKVTCLKKMKEGFKLLNAGNDFTKQIDELVNQIENDATSPGKILTDFEEISLVIVPELEYEAGDWVVPLVQAGSWLEGSNLVSKAITKSGKVDDASHLMKQAAVVDYFIRYVNKSKAKSTPAVHDKLVSTLTTLKGIASKDKITAADMKTISDSTDQVLSVLHN